MVKPFPTFPISITFDVDVTYGPNHQDAAEAHRRLVMALVETAIRETLDRHGYIDGPAPLRIVSEDPETSPDAPGDQEETPEPSGGLYGALRGLLGAQDPEK